MPGLSALFNQQPPSMAQLVSAGVLTISLGFLSPLHHFDRVLARLKRLLANLFGMPQRFVAGFEKTDPLSINSLRTTISENIALALKRTSSQDQIIERRHLFLFVCSGNTCRSPMAAALANAEIAARLQIPFRRGFKSFRAVSLIMWHNPGAPG